MILNEYSQEVVVRSHRLLTSPILQGFGLMFRRRLVDEGWVFVFSKTARWDLTNLFVFQSIDAVWLDANQCVLAKKTIKPFALRIRGHAGTRFVLELPAGAASQLPIGARVSWRNTQKGI